MHFFFSCWLFYFYNIDFQNGIIRIAHLLISVDKDPLLDQMLVRPPLTPALINLDLPGLNQTQAREIAYWVCCMGMMT